MSDTEPAPIIRALTQGDAAAVAQIYQEGIDTGHATFEPKASDWKRWDSVHRPDWRLAAELDGAVIGWAALCREQIELTGLCTIPIDRFCCCWACGEEVNPA